VQKRAKKWAQMLSKAPKTPNLKSMWIGEKVQKLPRKIIKTLIKPSNYGLFLCSENLGIFFRYLFGYLPLSI